MIQEMPMKINRYLTILLSITGISEGLPYIVAHIHPWMYAANVYRQVLLPDHCLSRFISQALA